jgi:hypothetical protein
MCDFCRKTGPGQYKFGYKSKFYDGVVAVNLCEECAAKVEAAGSVEKYLEKEGRHGSSK